MKTSVRLFLALAAALSWLTVPVRSEIVFDNSSNYLTNYWPSLLEYGDEIQLAGSARLVTNFVFEYFGSFTREGDETARIRFYKNDGPGRYPGPGTLLYDSGPFAIFSGLNAAPLNGLAVKVPDDFTWTVQFGGLTGLPGNQVGLPFYDPPTVGFSYRDFWQKTDPTGLAGRGWDLLSFPNFDPVANFAARVQATTEVQPPATVKLNRGKKKTNGHFEFELAGASGQSIVIQASSDLVNWTNVSTNMISADSINYDDGDADNFAVRFYRVNVRGQQQPDVSSAARGETERKPNLNYTTP